MKTYIISPSCIQGHLDCPRLQTAIDLGLKKTQTPEMLAGLWRHGALEIQLTEGTATPTREWLSRCLRRWADQHPEVAGLSDDLKTGVAEDILALADDPDLWTALDHMLVVEGRGMPKRFSTELHGKNMFLLDLVEMPEYRIQLRGVPDLVYVDPQVRGDLVVRDWKGRSGSYMAQEYVYPWVASRIWPGFERYIAEFVYVCEGGRKQRKEWHYSDMDRVRDVLVQTCQEIVDRRRAGDGHASQNRWCSSCPLQGDCSEWQTAVQPLTTDPAQRVMWPTDLSNLTDAQLLETHLAFSSGAKLVEDYASKLKEALKERMLAVANKKLTLADGRGVQLQKASGGYSYESVDELIKWSVRNGLDIERVLQTASDTSIKKAVNKLTDNVRRETCLAELDRIRALKEPVYRLVNIRGDE